MEKQQSKWLSYVLRHGADKEGIEMDSSGFVQLNELLKLKKSKKMKMDIEMVKSLVVNNDKQRFELKVMENEYYIRASQGHSMDRIQDEELLTLIECGRDFPIVVHGTYENVIHGILEKGLSRMGRNHIHFAMGENVISGMRKSAEIKIYIRMNVAMQDGIAFYTSKNGVVLTKGKDGLLDKKYFEKVLRVRDGAALYTNGL